MVIPHAEHQHHTRSHRLGDPRKPTVLAETIRIPKRLFRRCAKVRRDGIERGRHPRDVHFRVLNHLTVLNVQPADLLERAARSARVRDELRHDGEFGVGVHGLAWTVEACGTHTERVEVAPVGIAAAAISVARTTAGGAAAARGLRPVAGVRGVCGRYRVGFPDVHLVAAAAVVPGTGVNIVACGLPAFGVGLTEMLENDKYH